jgi:hypothetical protein
MSDNYKRSMYERGKNDSYTEIKLYTECIRLYNSNRQEENHYEESLRIKSLETYPS